MKPHPRIRKTIKWGRRGWGNGAAGGGVWIGSGWWALQLSGYRQKAVIAGGRAFAPSRLWESPNERRSISCSGKDATPIKFLSWRLGWEHECPLWALVIPALLCNRVPPWRLDAPRRHARALAPRLNLCPKCSYDRAGDCGGMRKCPECGGGSGEARDSSCGGVWAMFC